MGKLSKCHVEQVSELDWDGAKGAKSKTWHVALILGIGSFCEFNTKVIDYFKQEYELVSVIGLDRAKQSFRRTFRRTPMNRRCGIELKIL